MAWSRRNKSAPPPAARDGALRLLVRREHSASELRRKLAERGVDRDEAAAAIATLADENLQSDGRYAEQLVRTRIAQGYGPIRIRADLEVAGLARDLIAATMEAALEAEGQDWKTLAAAAHAKKFGHVPDGAAERARQQRFLYGRGFDGEQIRAVLRGDIDD